MNPGTHTVTIKLGDISAKEPTINAASTVRIKGQAAAVADLKAEMEVAARYRTDNSVVLGINSRAGKG